MRGSVFSVFLLQGSVVLLGDGQGDRDCGDVYGRKGHRAHHGQDVRGEPVRCGAEAEPSQADRA